MWWKIFHILINLIECFHSHGQHLGKFIGTKQSVCIRKEFNSRGLVWDTNMTTDLLFWDTNTAAVKSCENTLLIEESTYFAFLLEMKIGPTRVERTFWASSR